MFTCINVRLSTIKIFLINNLSFDNLTLKKRLMKLLA